MRAVVQRVLSASVTVDGEIVSQISRGLMVLVGIGVDDNVPDVETLAKKILNLKIFANSTDDMWKTNVKEIQGEILPTSTAPWFISLFFSAVRDLVPFTREKSADQSRAIYESFLKYMGSQYAPEKIKDGKFGAMMDVSLTNEGPVTFTLDSRKFEYMTPPIATQVQAQSSGKLAKSTEGA